MKAMKRVSIKDILVSTDKSMTMNVNNDVTCCAPTGKQREQKSTANAAGYKPYYEKLRDPRWQQMRLKIMERDGFSCQSCGDKSASLNVHHCVPYRKGADPWDYDPWELITLCENCHNKISLNVTFCNTVIMDKSRDIKSSETIMSLMMEISETDNSTIDAIRSLIQLAKVIN